MSGHMYTYTCSCVSEQCREIEANNRMGKTRELFKKENKCFQKKLKNKLQRIESIHRKNCLSGQVQNFFKEEKNFHHSII